MPARVLALVFGLLYTGLGVLGLMPGALAGLFPASPFLGVLHLLLGAWGLAAYAGRVSMPTYLVGAAFVLAILGLAGLLQGVDHGALPWLHLASAGLAGFIAWRPASGERRRLSGDRRHASLRTAAERRRGAYDRRKTPATA